MRGGVEAAVTSASLTTLPVCLLISFWMVAGDREKTMALARKDAIGFV